MSLLDTLMSKQDRLGPAPMAELPEGTRGHTSEVLSDGDIMTW